MTPRTPRPFASMPYLLGAIGLGLAGYYGEQWYRLPAYSDSDIEASVELNLQLDLQRRGAAMQPDDATLARMRDMVRSEVTADIRREREVVEGGLGAGLLMIVFAIGSMVFRRLARSTQ